MVLTALVLLQDEHSGRFQFDSVDFSLTISSCRLEDSGTYRCEGIGQPTQNDTRPELFKESKKVVVNGEFSGKARL